MIKNFFLYPLALLLFGLAIYATVQKGRTLESLRRPAIQNGVPTPAVRPATGVGPSASVLANLRQNFDDPLTRLFVQLILIVLVARLLGSAVQPLGQPVVVGEMIAGILLGPSLMGWLFPGFFNLIFPPPSLGTLRMLSQIGVCLFMFVIGMELDISHLKEKAHTAVVVSQVSILFPYLLGVVSALYLYPSQAPAGTGFLAFALFIGISMSITAFPVLARILEERDLTRTPLGSTALACAATGDVTAWVVLAFVVAIVKAGGLSSAILSMVFVVAFVAFMLLWVKPRIPRWLGPATLESSTPAAGVMAAVVVFIFACALATDVMGIHALFGAFLAGVAMPERGEFRNGLRIRLEHFSSVFLLPLFFVFTGLRAQIGLLNEPAGWIVCLALIAIATIGKLGGAMIAARVTGMNWSDSFALGALMNSRGLVEFIALNIGYDLGILSPSIFTMLVLMALVTTGMTGPLLGRRKSMV